MAGCGVVAAVYVHQERPVEFFLYDFQGQFNSGVYTLHSKTELTTRFARAGGIPSGRAAHTCQRSELSAGKGRGLGAGDSDMGGWS